MNTLFTYLYRDASNYKKHGEVVLRGPFTEAQLTRLRSALFDGENFLAEKIGVPLVAHWAGDEFAENEDDHPFHEFGALEHTSQDATQNDTVEELVRKIEFASAAGWSGHALPRAKPHGL